MVLLWYEYALIAAIFAGVLALTASFGVSFFRVRVQKWIGGAIGNFMTNLANQAAEEEGGSSSSTSSGGALELGGFKIDPQLIELAIKYGPQLIELAKSVGLIKGGGGGTNPFLTP